MITTTPSPRLARIDDIDELLALWATLFGDEPHCPEWVQNARAWFGTAVNDYGSAVFPVIEVGGDIAACAIGTLELGVPNPHCPHGRSVRLTNVVTAPEHRGHGLGTELVQYVIAWARSINADRMDLSATPEGRRIYQRAGFADTSAPRMKLVL